MKAGKDHSTDPAQPCCSSLRPDELIPPAVFYQRNIESVHIRSPTCRASTSSKDSDSTILAEPVFLNATAPPLSVEIKQCHGDVCTNRFQYFVKDDTCKSSCSCELSVREPLLSEDPCRENPFLGESSVSSYNLQPSSEAPTLCIRENEYIPEDFSLKNCVDWRTLSAPTTQDLHGSFLEVEAAQQVGPESDSNQSYRESASDTSNAENDMNHSSVSSNASATIPKTICHFANVPAAYTSSDESTTEHLSSTKSEKENKPDFDQNKNLLTPKSEQLPSKLERGTSTSDLKPQTVTTDANSSNLPSMVFNGPATIRIGHQQIGQHQNMLHLEAQEQSEGRPMETATLDEINVATLANDEQNHGKTESDTNTLISEVEHLQEEKLNQITGCSCVSGDPSLKAPVQVSQTILLGTPPTTCSKAQAEVATAVYSSVDENIAVKCEV